MTRDIRIQRDVLDASFFQRVRILSAWIEVRVGDPDPDETTLLDAIKHYAEDAKLTELSAREFLWAPMFELFHSQTSGSDARLGQRLRGVVTVNRIVAREVK